jgi:hypothetical protein
LRGCLRNDDKNEEANNDDMSTSRSYLWAAGRWKTTKYVDKSVPSQSIVDIYVDLMKMWMRRTAILGRIVHVKKSYDEHPFDESI